MTALTCQSGANKEGAPGWYWTPQLADEEAAWVGLGLTVRIHVLLVVSFFLLGHRRLGSNGVTYGSCNLVKVHGPEGAKLATICPVLQFILLHRFQKLGLACGMFRSTHVVHHPRCSTLYCFHLIWFDTDYRSTAVTCQAPKMVSSPPPQTNSTQHCYALLFCSLGVLATGGCFNTEISKKYLLKSKDR